MNIQRIAKIEILLSLLKQHNKVHHLSIAFSMAACFLLSMLIVSSVYFKFGVILSIMVVIFGIVEALLAVRIGFDIDLFKRLVSPDVDINIELGHIDKSLVSMKFMPENKVGRDLDLRIQGTYALFKKQIFACLLQALMIITSGIYSMLS